MDEMSTKAINIAVALFITIIIISGLFFVINQIKTIYGQVYETDTSIQNSFTEFDQYDNTEKTGIDMLNAAKKYANNPTVLVCKNNTELTESNFLVNYKNADDQDLASLGEEKYKCSVTTDASTGITTIKFSN